MSSQKPNVLMVGPDLSMQGGIAAVASGLISGGLGDACNLQYVSTACEGTWLKKSLKYLQGLAKFKKAVDSVDVVHIHVSVRGSFRRKYGIAEIAKVRKKPLVLHEHNGEFAEIFESESDEYRAKVREFFGWADAVIVLSEEWRDYFATNVCDEKKIVVMHNAVSLPQIPADPCARQDVLFLGRLGACKSPDVLLHAAKSLRARFPEVRYRFAGDGDIEKYKALAEELGVVDQCDFLGWIKGNEKERLIRESGIFCLPSRHEGMPMSLLEMMSYGLPCIVTPVGGIPQVIHDGENGYMVAVGDSEELAIRLQRLFLDSTLRYQIGIAARQTITTGFNIGSNVANLASLYNALAC